ncbi:MAG TPA: hypothetical protein VF147_07355 [Vicinamibacterales bacterium]
MAQDKNTSNPAFNKEKAEGDRSTAEQNYDRTPGDAGGITNRPLDEEIDNQEAVPDRGRRKDEER